MVVLEATEINLQLSDLQNWHRHPEPKHKRQPGVHLSGVLRVMAKEFNLLKDIEPQDFEEDYPLRMVIGLAVERQLAGLYPGMTWQPKPITKDGITGSMDGLIGQAIAEFKYTHKTCRDFDLKQLKHKLWVWQMMGYCVLVGCRLAWLHVMFGNGDYSRPYKERYIRYLVEFEQSELDRFWGFVLKFRDQAIAE